MSSYLTLMMMDQAEIDRLRQTVRNRDAKIAKLTALVNECERLAKDIGGKAPAQRCSLIVTAIKKNRQPTPGAASGGGEAVK